MPALTTREIRRTLRMSAIGSASRTTRSAWRPAPITPSSLPAPSISAAVLVAACSVATGDRPASTWRSSSISADLQSQLLFSKASELVRDGPHDARGG
jgi:hypothetical protein